MTIQEAIKSGKPFHRKKWDWWWVTLEKNDEVPGGIELTRTLVMESATQLKAPATFFVDDILADDWEIEEDK